MNYLKPIPASQFGLRPTRTWNDLSVVLHCDPVTLQPQLPDELLNVGRLLQRVEGASLTIQNQLK